MAVDAAHHVAAPKETEGFVATWSVSNQGQLWRAARTVSLQEVASMRTIFKGLLALTALALILQMEVTGQSGRSSKNGNPVKIER